MIENKKSDNRRQIVLAISFTAFIVFIGIFLIEKNNNQNKITPVSVDFTVFPGEQNIGAEIPPLIYADENIAMSFVSSALIIYDFKSKSIVDSVDMSFFYNDEFNDIDTKVTKDGKIIRFSRANILYGIPDKTIFEYSIKTHTLVEKVRQEEYEDCVEMKEMQEPYKGYSHIDEEFYPCYVIDISEDKFAYLSSTDWLVKHLYIGVIDKNTKQLEKYNLFKS